MRTEVRHGKSSLEMASVLEEDINYDSKKHEWAPEVDRMGLQSAARTHSTVWRSIG